MLYSSRGREEKQLDGEKVEVEEEVEEEEEAEERECDSRGGEREREKREGRGYPVCSQLNASTSFVPVAPRAASFAAPWISSKQLENAQT